MAVVIGVNQLEHHFLQPVLMGRVLSIHGLAILLVLAAGTILAGIVGALLAVPITAVAWTVVKTWTGKDPLPGLEPPGPELRRTGAARTGAAVASPFRTRPAAGRRKGGPALQLTGSQDLLLPGKRPATNRKIRCRPLLTTPSRRKLT